MSAAVPRQLLRLAVAAQEQGWTIRRARKGGVRWYAPDGKTIVSTKPDCGDHRALSNAVADLARAGLTVQGRPRSRASAPSHSDKERVPTMAAPEPELDRATVAETLKCRYRYATGCTAEYPADQKQSLYTHEKVNSAHALHRVTLTACPEPGCGRDFTGEQARAIHLSGEHGVMAGSEYRQHRDAEQVRELFNAQYGAADGMVPAGAAVVLETAATVFGGHGAEPAPEPVRVPAPLASLNGHSPVAPVDLSATLDTFTALAAEVEALRAENAVLRAEAEMLRQIRGLLAAD